MSFGVLVMAYGTPRDRDDVEAYYTDVRRGRKPSAELLAELVERYDAIGGTFPLREMTERQCVGLQAALHELVPGETTVALGYKHARPSLEDGVGELAAAGVQRIVGLVMAPHYSAMSVGEYAGRAATAGATAGLAVRTVDSWHLLDGYLEFLVGAVREAAAEVPAGSEVVFTAHSLPRRIVESGDPYPTQLRETATAVAERAGLDTWSVAWQSAGRTSEPWLGPDVREVLRRRARTEEVPGLVVCPCGFVADHLEVLYDLDIEARMLADELRLPFARTKVMNDDPTVLRALAELVCERAGG